MGSNLSKPAAVLHGGVHSCDRAGVMEQATPDAERIFALEEANRGLERRVASLDARLEQVAGELQSFLYSVSHDLRAPLRAIDGFSRMLVESKAQQLDAEGVACLERVCSQAARMAGLIDDLAMLARIAQADIARREVNLSEIAGAMLTRHAGAEPLRRVSWRVKEGVLANADAGLVRILLGNLLCNAWKFTARSERAHIEFGMTDTPMGRAIFVRDNGAGFDMQFAGKLFGAFQRMHPEKDFAGRGIGLATARRIVLRHGGDCWAESTPQGGTSIYFTLP